MPCPECDSTNMGRYDRETYECKDCGHLTHKSKYKHYKSRKGKCKIIGYKHTKDIYGTNRDMIAWVGDEKIRNYETERIDDNRGRNGWAYRVGQWVWNIKDLVLLDEDGNDIADRPLPEPVQFDTKSLFI